MCHPLVAVGLLAAGTAAKAYGAYKGAKASNAANEYNAQLLERNADISEMQILDAQDRGKTNIKNIRTDAESLAGSQRASFGASGAVVGQGSTLDVEIDTKFLGEMDAMTSEMNTKREIEGLTKQAENYRSQAQLSRMGKRSAGEAAGISLLSGAASMGGSYLLGKAK